MAGEFQSHAGSIEARIRVRSGAGHYEGFNPTLVRLRPPEPGFPVPRGRGFQSHAGSIEAGGGGRTVADPAEVSIPRWFD